MPWDRHRLSSLMRCSNTGKWWGGDRMGCGRYYVNATNTLKAEGNALVKEQKYSEALEK